MHFLHQIRREIHVASQGQTLVEVLIAISITVLIVSSMTIAVITAISNTDYSKNQNLATQFAQEGMEVVKQLEGTNYQTLSSLNGRYCLAQTCSTLTTTTGSCGLNAAGNTTNCSTNVNNNFFIRQIDMLPAGAAGAKCINTIQATVSVLWTDGKCTPAGTYCHSEQIVSCFSNVNTVATP
ncbi:MAG TPA: hypothetical protein VLG12_04275 [Candidatus Saccharimonadales bacterium]|nr:hypothetical protein [Candidatus Saccharimonadales bacterium]